MLPDITPIAPDLIKRPFDDPEWLFELKYDGFRALAYIDAGTCKLISRNEFHFTRFADLAASIAKSVPADMAILDGEIVCLDGQGRARFYDLMFNSAPTSFAAFDIVYLEGEDLRDDPLLDRKAVLRDLVADANRLLCVDHIDEHGKALFDTVCEVSGQDRPSLPARAICP